jgi:hypothetical protein
MPTTYDPIATQTLAIAAVSIDFTSIPSTYTDLKLVVTGKNGVAGSFLRLQFNGDTGNNYSNTNLYGNGSSATSSRSTSAPGISFRISDASQPGLNVIDIFSYQGSTFKTALIEVNNDLNGSGEVNRIVGLWRNTAAITSLSFFPYSAGSMLWAVGTTATLYGIKNA